MQLEKYINIRQQVELLQQKIMPTPVKELVT
jgi:hypothetical protein